MTELRSQAWAYSKLLENNVSNSYPKDYTSDFLMPYATSSEYVLLAFLWFHVISPIQQSSFYLSFSKTLSTLCALWLLEQSTYFKYFGGCIHFNQHSSHETITK